MVSWSVWLLMGTSVFLQKNWRKYLFHMILFVFVTFCFAGVFEGILAILRPSLTAGIALAAVVCRFILRRLWKKKLECSPYRHCKASMAAEYGDAEGDGRYGQSPEGAADRKAGQYY